MRMQVSCRFSQFLMVVLVFGVLSAAGPLHAWTHYGDLRLVNQEAVNGLAPGLTEVYGNVFIGPILPPSGTNITDLALLNSLETVTGELSINGTSSLTQLDGFGALVQVGSHLNIVYNSALLTINGFNNLQKVTGNLNFTYNDALRDINGFAGLTDVWGTFGVTFNQSLASLNGFPSLNHVQLNVVIARNNALAEMAGFSKLRDSQTLHISMNPMLTRITGFDVLNFLLNLTIAENPALGVLDGFALLEKVNSNLKIDKNILLSEISGFSTLRILNKLTISGNPALTGITGFGALDIVSQIAIADNRELDHYCGFYRVCSIGTLSTWSTTNNKSNPTREQVVVDCTVKGTIAGIVWNDLNCNGVHDEGEPGIDGIEVQVKGLLMDGSDDRQLTSNGGRFKFSGQTPMEYRVYINKSTLPADLECTNGVEEFHVTLVENGYKVVNFFYAQANCDSLVFVTGSPTHPGEEWDNAVDHDTTDWDGTVTTRGPQGDPAGPAWGIFQFACPNAGRFNQIAFKTDNGVDQVQQYNRQAKEIQIWTSNTGTEDADFTMLATIAHHSRLWTAYDLPETCARYIKLVINTPTKANGAWRQLVEFRTMLIENKNGEAAPMAKRLIQEAKPAEGYALEQNYPNPFNPVTSIGFELAESGSVSIKIYDLNGREVATLVDGVESAGRHTVVWNAVGMPSGSYMVRLSTEKYQDIKRMVLLK